MSGLVRDLGYFWRTVTRSPGFFVLAVLTLALGIGANTAIFSVINSVLLRPLPFVEPDRLVQLFETEAAPGRYPFAGPDYLDWKAQNHTLQNSALFSWYSRANVGGSGGAQAEAATTLRAEASFFDVLGVNPFMGRTFRKDDGVGGNRVAVISYGFWQRHFAGDPGIINKHVELDAKSYQIVGVMPSWFTYPRNIEIWTPMDVSLKELGSRGNHSYQSIARLKRGVSAEQAQADLAIIAKRLEQQFPDTNEKVGASVVPMKEQLTRRAREPLLILLGAVALVLLVACANVANLLLIRAGTRRRELAIRSAIGAGRWRVIRQLLTESLVLALVGAAAGLAAAWWGVRALQGVKTLPIPVVTPIQIDLSVLLFTLGAAVITGLLFGTLPAWQASGAGLSEELKSGSHAVRGGSGRARRVRDAIAVAEIALSLALLVGAGLLLRSFDKMRNADIGVDTTNVLTMSLSLPEAKYDTAEARLSFCDRLIERIRSTPGIRTATYSTLLPIEGGSNGYITVPGQDDSRLKNQLFEWNYVSADYHRTFGIRLLQGRNFTRQDEEQAFQVSQKIAKIFSATQPDTSQLKGLSWPAMINQTMAQLVWPKEDPIGKLFVIGGALEVRVIGVASDVNVQGLRDEKRPQAYLPFAAAVADSGFLNLVVKTDSRPLGMLPAIRQQLASLDPTLAIINPRTMNDVVADGMADTTLQTWLLGAFAAIALLLAGVGLYSVMASLVAQRRHEIGVRTALGAQPGDLLRLVLGHATWLTAIGLAVGLATAFALTRLLRGLLFGVAATDATTFVAVSGLVVLVALLACVVPARRATRVDPIIALRVE